MPLVPSVTFKDELSGDTIIVVPGCYSLPCEGDYVWLGEAGSPLVEYKVEKVSHYFAPIEGAVPVGQAVQTVNGAITIRVSVV
jgi:hypothetical protein